MTRARDFIAEHLGRLVAAHFALVVLILFVGIAVLVLVAMNGGPQ